MWPLEPLCLREPSHDVDGDDQPDEGDEVDEPPATLTDVGDKFGLSRERIRQLQVQALRKLREASGGVLSDFAEA